MRKHEDTGEQGLQELCAAPGCDLGCEGCPRAPADLSVLTELKRGWEKVDLS